MLHSKLAVASSKDSSLSEQSPAPLEGLSSILPGYGRLVGTDAFGPIIKRPGCVSSTSLLRTGGGNSGSLGLPGKAGPRIAMAMFRRGKKLNCEEGERGCLLNWLRLIWLNECWCSRGPQRAYVLNTLAKCGSLEDALEVFCRLPCPIVYPLDNRDLRLPSTARREEASLAGYVSLLEGRERPARQV